MARRLKWIIDDSDVGARHPTGGLITSGDIGKAVYDVDGVVQVENNDQLAARETTNSQLQRLQDLRDLIEDQRAHNQRLRRYLDGI